MNDDCYLLKIAMWNHGDLLNKATLSLLSTNKVYSVDDDCHLLNVKELI